MPICSWPQRLRRLVARHWLGAERFREPRHVAHGGRPLEGSSTAGTDTDYDRSLPAGDPIDRQPSPNPVNLRGLVEAARQ